MKVHINIKYSVFLTNLCSGKISNPDLRNMDNYEFLRLLASKLSTAAQQRWIHVVGRLRDKDQRSPTLEDFDKFVGQSARDENDPRISGLGYQRVKADRSSNTGPQGKSFRYKCTTESEEQYSEYSCAPK